MKPFLLLLLFSLAFVQQSISQFAFSTDLSSGWHFPKRLDDGVNVNGGLYTGANCYRIGASSSYGLSKSVSVGADIAFQSYAYHQNTIGTKFQHSGLTYGLFTRFKRKRLLADVGCQYVMIVKKTFGDPFGYANPNFWQGSIGLGYQIKKWTPFVKYYHGLTEFHKFELTILPRGRFRKLYTREIMIGISHTL